VFDRAPHFHVLRFPVRIELWFFLIAFLFGLRRDYLPAYYILEWMAVTFVAILVHELGHAMAFRRFGQESRVVLTGMGGLTYGSAPFQNRREDIIVSLAGPLTGIVVLGIPAYVLKQGLDFDSSLFVATVVRDLYLVSIIWSLINLAPVLPLDGGHVSQALFGRPMARRISVVAALALAIYLFQAGYDCGPFFFLILAVLSGVEIYFEYRAGGAPRVALLPPSPGEWGGGYGGGDYGPPPSRAQRRRKAPKPTKPMSSRKAKQRAHLSVVPDSPAELNRIEGPVPVGLDQVETVGWRAVRDGDVVVARRALAKVPDGAVVDPFLRPSVDLLADDLDEAVDGFVAAYAARPGGPSGILPASLLGRKGKAVEVAERVLATDGAGAAFAVSGLQSHLHVAEHFVNSANVGERLHADARANRAQVAFEVACAWSRADRHDRALAWLGRAIDDGFTAGSLLDGEKDLAETRRDPGWAAVRSRLP
jgi:stage IV sporulation protein FB